MENFLSEGKDAVTAKYRSIVTYRICPATPEDVRWIAGLEAEVYSSQDAIPFHVLSEWYASNPGGFNVIRRGDEKIGHVDVLPLRPGALRRILDGKLMERDLRGEDLYGPDERHAIQNLYVESVAVRPTPGSSSGPVVSFILANFDSLVRRLCEPASVDKVYAIAASEAGERLMRRLGFARTGSADERVDKHELWGVTLSALSNKLSVFLRRRGRREAS